MAKIRIILGLIWLLVAPESRDTRNMPESCDVRSNSETAPHADNGGVIVHKPIYSFVQEREERQTLWENGCIMSDVVDIMPNPTPQSRLAAAPATSAPLVRHTLSGNH
jgi:hypothetical protein